MKPLKSSTTAVLTTMFKSRRGSTFVEVAVIMPLVILAVMSLFYILINLYENAELKSRLHLGICIEAGYRSETFEISPAASEGLKLDSDKKKVTGSSHKAGYYGGLLKRHAAMKETGHNHIVIEEDIIRKADYVLPE